MMNNSMDRAANQNLLKALQILEAFSSEKPEWRMLELGHELNINPATLHRMLATLCQSGYLERNLQTRAYTLGPKIMKLAGTYTQLNPIPLLARKVFESFSARFEYNFYLGSLSHYDVIYLAVYNGQGPLKIVVEPGGTAYLNTTAIGKILLAFQSDSFIKSYIEEAGLRARTARSITDPDEFWKQIQQIREQRYAINDGENFDDVSSVGVPINDPLGKVSMSVSLTFPRHLITEQRLSIDELISLAHEVAREIELRIGVLTT